MVGSVNSIAMSAFARVSMGIEEHSSDFGIASLNIANGFVNQDNPYGFSRLSPNNEEGPAFTDMSSMGGLSSVSAVTSHMVNAIQNVNTDSAVTDRSFIDEIEAITNARSVFELPDPSDDVSAAATTAALVALAGTGAVGSSSAVAAVSNIGDQSTIGSNSTISSDVDPMNTSSSDASSPPSYTEEPITSSGGSGSGEALSGLGGSSALSGDAQQAVMIEEFAEISSQQIDTGESRAEAGVGLAQTTKAFREMEASTKLQDDIEITHAKALSLVLMGS